MKIILKKDAEIRMWTEESRIDGIINQKDIEFTIDELCITAVYGGRQSRYYRYKKPYPKYKGVPIMSIEWYIKDTNESIVED